MSFQKIVIGALLVLLPSVPLVSSVTDIECISVSALVFSCYIYGSPDPSPGTPCCNSMVSIKMISDFSVENRRFACRCLMKLITTYNPNGYELDILPDFCRVSLGFSIDPNTDCDLLYGNAGYHELGMVPKCEMGSASSEGIHQIGFIHYSTSGMALAVTAVNWVHQVAIMFLVLLYYLIFFSLYYLSS